MVFQLPLNASQEGPPDLDSPNEVEVEDDSQEQDDIHEPDADEQEAEAEAEAEAAPSPPPPNPIERPGYGNPSQAHAGTVTAWSDQAGLGTVKEDSPKYGVQYSISMGNIRKAGYGSMFVGSRVQYLVEYYQGKFSKLDKLWVFRYDKYLLLADAQKDPNKYPHAPDPGSNAYNAF